MPSSPARIAANRRNASKSCGPKTTDGKATSRRNALKHGLTGEGVALPTEDSAEVERRFSALAEEFGPTTESGRLLVRRYAFLSVRLERCERHETSMLSKRVREAICVYDDERLAEVERLAAEIMVDPMTCSRRLQGTPEGVDWLVECWRELRGDLMIEGRVVWTWSHWGRAEALLGNPQGNVRISRPLALTEAVGGFFGNLEAVDGAGLDDAARSRWARDELAALIDGEIARLLEAREALDPEALDRERLEAPDRALFDPSPEMTLARKYEAATDRAMSKALRDFRQVEAEAVASRTAPPGAPACQSVASFETESEPAGPAGEVARTLPPPALPTSLPGPRISPLPPVHEAMQPLESAEMALRGSIEARRAGLSRRPTHRARPVTTPPRG